MRLLVVALSAMVPASANAVAVPGASVVRAAPLAGPPDCPRTARHYAYRDGKKLKPRNLAELPDANAYKAVLRHDGRCEVPVIVKYRVSRR